MWEALIAIAGWKQVCVHFGKGLWGSENKLWLAHHHLHVPYKDHCCPPRDVLCTSLPGEDWNSFTFSRDVEKKTNVLATWKALLKLGGSCGVGEWAVASLCTFVCLAKVTFVCREKVHCLYVCLELSSS